MNNWAGNVNWLWIGPTGPAGENANMDVRQDYDDKIPNEPNRLPSLVQLAVLILLLLVGGLLALNVLTIFFPTLL